MTGKLALLVTDIQCRLDDLVNEPGGYLDPSRQKSREDLRRSRPQDQLEDEAEIHAYALAAIDFLKKELNWHRSVLDQLPAPVSVYDLNLRWSYINRAAAEMIGSGRPEYYLGKRYRDGWKNYATDDDSLADEEQEHLRRLMRPVDEKGRFLVSSSSFLTDDLQQPIGLIETLREASAEEETIEVLSDDDEARRTALEATPMACLYFDQDGFLSDCNQEAATLMGLSDKRKLLRYFYRLMPWKLPNGQTASQVVMDCLLASFDQGYSHYDHMLLRSAAGFEIPVRIRMSRIRWRGTEAVLACLYPKSQHSFVVLVVEDIEVNQLMIKGLLSRLGLKVKLSANGRQAVEMVRTENFDLVFMDVEMPLMDGLAATREIRALPNRRDLPIISLTSLDSEEDLARCRAAGMDDRLPKPVDLSNLRLCLDKWLALNSKAA